MITNVRPRPSPSRVEYDVVWNGTHRGCDADLLVPEARVPEKRVGSPLDLKAQRGELIARLLNALPRDRADAIPYAELLTRAACERNQVNGTIQWLRAKGLLASEDIPDLPYRTSRPPQRYWRTT